MKRLIMKPADFPCTLEECPSGHFLWEDTIGFKTEYRTELGTIDVYCDSGERFCRPSSIVVTPLIYEWEEV